MRVPGEAQLEFLIGPEEPEAVTLQQTARFRPKGLAGLVYWYVVLPAHNVVFQGLLDGIRRAAEEGSAEPG